ncbi:MAG: toxin-antitoxin system YwqK family antitoxin [Pseudomonadales bacterium]|jgi:antitoxin component YwqK of YwqJK toxin-antitoxin module
MKLRLITTLLTLCFVLMGCNKELPVFDGEVLKRDGLLYKPDSTVPLTAKVEHFHENGQLKTQYTAIEGKREGLVKDWYENGQLYTESTWVKGELNGVYRNWRENGQLRQELPYVNGELEGLGNFWRENGQPLTPKCYKAGEETDMSYCEPQA